MRYWVLCFVTVAAGICLATAQNSQVHSSSAKSSSDSLQKATKPLTPKSAMPPQHKSSGVVPGASTSGQNTSKELDRLEHQSIKTPSTKSSTAPAKRAAVNSPAKSSGNDSGINATYQKPHSPRN
jgi:negative regulator of sigma E activity